MPTKIPMPDSGFLNLNTLREFQVNPFKYLMDKTAEYGDIFKLPLGPVVTFNVVVHPDLIQQLLVKEWSKTVKWERNVIGSSRVAPNNLVILEGDMWKKHRKLVTPAFHIQRIQDYITLMQRHTTQRMAMWQSGQVKNIHQEMVTTTMGIIGEILFDIPDIENDAEHLSKSLMQWLYDFVDIVGDIFIFPEWVPTKRNRNFKETRATIKAYFDEKIQQRRAENADHGDVLSALLQATDAETGAALSNDEVRDELTGLFLAGHETTAVLMTWVLYLLAKHPEIEQSVYEEVCSIMGDVPTMEQVKQLDLTSRVLQETLRLYPPAWGLFQRTATDNIQLGDMVIKKGEAIFVSPYIPQHDSRWWDNPEVFNPARFEGDWKAGKPSYAYMPFGGGPRVCVGSHLAELEAHIMLATIIKKYRIELETPTQDTQPAAFFTLHPIGGMALRLHQR